MPGLLRTAAMVMAGLGVCLSHRALSADSPRRLPTEVLVQRSAPLLRGTLKDHAMSRHALSWEQRIARTAAPDREPYADPAAPYKANRLASSRGRQSIANTPGQITVLTRQVLDDKNATTLKDALRTTAGVTVGR
jgi:outer membrane receptor for monomeric catechols